MTDQICVGMRFNDASLICSSNYDAGTSWGDILIATFTDNTSSATMAQPLKGHKHPIAAIAVDETYGSR